MRPTMLCRWSVIPCNAWLEAESMIMLEAVFIDIVWMSVGMVSFDSAESCYLPVLFFRCLYSIGMTGL